MATRQGGRRPPHGPCILQKSQPPPCSERSRMAIEVTWLGHGTFAVASGKHRLIIDPFLDDNPAAPLKAKEIEADFVLVSHGHFDHISDAASIANRTSAMVLANYEV